MQLKIENDKAVVYAPYWLTEQEIDSFVSDKKLSLLEEFMLKNNYELAFRNDKFAVYR